MDFVVGNMGISLIFVWMFLLFVFLKIMFLQTVLEGNKKYNSDSW